MRQGVMSRLRVVPNKAIISFFTESFGFFRNWQKPKNLTPGKLTFMFYQFFQEKN